MDTCFADMSLAWCEQELSYCYRLRGSIDANIEVAKGDPALQCWLFDKPYTDMYLMCGGTHWKRGLKFALCQRTAVRNPIFVGWPNLGMFAVLRRDYRRQYVSVSAFWKN